MRTPRPAHQPFPPLSGENLPSDGALRTREGHFEIIEIEDINGLIVCVTAKQEPKRRSEA